MIQRSTLALGICVALLGGASVAHAQTVALEGDIEIPENNDAYVSADGEVVRTGLGECLRLGTLEDDDLVNACEGIEDTVAEVVPEPEPVPVAPAPEPEPTQRVELKEMDDRANFQFDSAELTPEGEAEMQALFDQLGDFKPTEVMVIGHTDSSGPEEYNMGLSEERAATVATMLAERYPDASITTEGRGESDPIATNETAEGRRMNRRVEIDLTASRMTFE